MRQFSSYGPVDRVLHFALARTELVERCVEHLIGDPERGGHFFTLYAPRQAGKTWLMRRAMEQVQQRYGERFQVGILSLQGLMRDGDPDDIFLRRVGRRFGRTLLAKRPRLQDWDDWLALFDRESGVFDRPLILLIDEFDSLTRTVVDQVVGLFRQMYLARESYVLHGLALVGVRAVLGVDSPRGSPFNIQRSLHVPNFTQPEVAELFRQYQEESGQVVLPEVVDRVFDEVRGQPGLTCWFGELLTDKFNVDPSQPIDLACWRRVYGRALHTERNNNIFNLTAKAKTPFARDVHALFVESDIPFAAGKPWCDHLELNGIIAPELLTDEQGRETYICRFASPFVQRRLYDVFSEQLHDMLADVPAFDGTDTLEDVFLPERLDVVALLQRYKAYLDSLREAGRDPFRDQPMRADFQLPEAVGHFHLYAWLQQATGRECSITPEFPTGNGKVDLRILHRGRTSLVEVKSLAAARELPRARAQAAKYAAQQGLSEATLVLFVPTKRPELLATFEGSAAVDEVRVHVVAVSWRP